LRLCLGLGKEIFAIECLIMIRNGLVIVGLGVLQGLDRDLAVE
jgi:hypothetical protein